MNPREIIYYRTPDGWTPFKDWFRDFRNSPLSGKVMSRLERIAAGNWGDFKNIGMGVFEIRIHWGPGYRIYFGLDGTKLVVLLWAGDKSSQDRDILRVQAYWQDYLRRKL